MNVARVEICCAAADHLGIAFEELFFCNKYYAQDLENQTKLKIKMWTEYFSQYKKPKITRETTAEIYIQFLKRCAEMNKEILLKRDWSC
jgi:hypothetical protein